MKLGLQHPILIESCIWDKTNFIATKDLSIDEPHWDVSPSA